MMTIRVFMKPTYEEVKGQPHGIARVIEAWHKYMPQFGVEFVDNKNEKYDLKAAHAGIAGDTCDVSHLHGMYFTGDYHAPRYEYDSNKYIAMSCRYTKAITVPSEWVSEIFRRDMHMSPFVVPHGIEADEWINGEENEHYVLWNKNRGGVDACTTDHLEELAHRFPEINFLSTFAPRNNVALPNLKVVGVIPPQDMKKVLQRSGIYLSTTKETFGIGILEAMASGIPILGFDYGGNSVLVEHKINGYLAEPGNYDDLSYGLQYCITNAHKLGMNGVILSHKWTWEKSCQKLYEVYDYAVHVDDQPNDVSVVIPCYNKESTIADSIKSIYKQTITPKEIVVVDDGSTDNSAAIIQHTMEEDNGAHNIVMIVQKNQGVANARNNGIHNTSSKYVCCLDGDDTIAPTFLEVCKAELDKDRSLGIAYTGLMIVDGNGRETIGTWPGEFNYDGQTKGSNQIPTCCVFRRDMFDRLGGYRQRYAPMGMGVEDAEFWLRAGSIGFNAKKVTQEPLFIYRLGGGTSQGGYYDNGWGQMQPWIADGKHPFASLATPEHIAHDVIQYDLPVVSVIIPVGTGHEMEIVNALDSLEAQTFRRWEVVVVWDSVNPVSNYLKKAFPFMHIYYTDTPKRGAGVARNIGAKHAKGQFLMFLDADDSLYPDAINKMLSQYQYSEGIIYSDYDGKAIIAPENVDQFKERMLSYNAKTHEAVLKHLAANYNCDDAQRQPDIESKRLYHWCLVTCLIPKRWHDEIGGFDESMRSWEDVDYHWRMAKAGKCYIRIEESLMLYRFNTGTRRELASDTNSAKSLIQYMVEKYRSIKNMPCPGGCGNQRPYDPQLDAANQKRTTLAQSGKTNIDMNDKDFLMCTYTHPNMGEHNVFGGATRINYGYRSGGDTFLVNVADIAATPHLFKVVKSEAPAPDPIREVPKENPTVKDENIPELVSQNVSQEPVPVKHRGGRPRKVGV